jgi:hypothetical protein
MRVGDENDVRGSETKEPLTETGIKMAKLEIAKLHPIAEAGWDVAFPWMCCGVGKWKAYQERKRQADLLASGL